MKRLRLSIQTLSAALLASLLTACGTGVDSNPEQQTTAAVPETKTESEQPAAYMARSEADRLQRSRLSAAISPSAEDTSARLASPNAADKLRRVSVRNYEIAIGHPPIEPVNREVYGKIIDFGVKAVAEAPVSTFSIDVDTGAYALVRRSLNQGRLPATDSVRIEELINYFDYPYPLPREQTRPFSVTTEVSRTPWNPNSHLLHIGIKGIQADKAQRPAANLVFLVDVSGSMQSNDKLPLLKSAFKLLIKQLNEKDRVSLVVYAGASGLVLEPTKGNEKGKIFAALDKLSAGGSTHGSAGIELAYAMAEQARIAAGINRVILATDGDFNVGTVNHEQLMDLIERKRELGISLTTLGFGQGNYNDHLMEQLADRGNGNYAYIDNINEARKVLVEELSATLETIAKDVKIQIEWNPAQVAEYRLIGYANRMLAREDFSNDKVDAGDIGAGHSVTAIYEITLVGEEKRRLEALRYQPAKPSSVGDSGELAYLRLRYKVPEGEQSQLIEQVIRRRDIITDLTASSDRYRFSAAVAGFGQLLRGGRYTESFDYAAVAALARGARGDDPFGYRGEFLRLVNLASSL